MSDKNEKQNNDKGERNKDLPETECCFQPFACSTLQFLFCCFDEFRELNRKVWCYNGRKNKQGSLKHNVPHD